MPFALKGIDATIFMAFQALGAEVRVRPILRSDELEQDLKFKIKYSGDKYEDDEWESNPSDTAPSEYTEKEYMIKRKEHFAAKMENLCKIGDQFHELVVADDGKGGEGNIEEVCPVICTFVC